MQCLPNLFHLILKPYQFTLDIFRVLVLEAHNIISCFSQSDNDLV